MTCQEYYDKLVIMPADEMVAFITSKGSPATGAPAEAIWHLLSGRSIQYNIALRTYERCGYMPFMGYPLKKAFLERS